MKKEIRGFITGVLLTGAVMACIPAFASNMPKAVSFAVNSVKIALNGRTIPVDNISYNGSTYVKLSQICAIFGRDTSWNGKTKTVNITDVQPSSTSASAVEVIPKQESKVVTSQAVNVKPEVVSVKLPDTIGTIEIVFNKKIDKADAENTSNYSFSFPGSTQTAISIVSISMDPTGSKVAIQTKHALPVVFDFTISNIKDDAGISMDPYTIKLKR